MRLFYSLILHFLILNNIFPQDKYPADYFRTPLPSGYNISSNFGEIRPSHFHAGLDYNAKSGENVYAIANGFISRVKVSSKGYGNAIYISHPNGFVSVYAHLSEFCDELATYVYKAQHDRQLFEIDDYLYPGEYSVSSGDIIGKTGNTGRSFGPHLHFEIRDEITEEPINPLYFGMRLQDVEPPGFKAVYFYKFADKIEGHKYTGSGILSLQKKDTLKIYGKVGFGVEVHDYMRRKENEKFGLYKLELMIDDSLIFKFQMERISFDESKYLNSFVDYDRYRSENLKITKCFIEPNNKLKIYKSTGNGIYNFSDGKSHTVRIKASDINGNSSFIRFIVLSDSTTKTKSDLRLSPDLKEINCKKEELFTAKDFYLGFSNNSLYYNINFHYNTTHSGSKIYSKYHHIHNQAVPLHLGPVLRIKPYPIPESLKPKALIVGINRNHEHFYAGGIWKGDSLETTINTFGTYYVSVDTIEPVIKKLIPGNRKNLDLNKLKFQIWDNLSGIGEIVSFIDNKWVLFEYDEKNNLITCNLIKEKIERGEHFLVLWVTDQKGNIASYESKFTY